MFQDDDTLRVPSNGSSIPHCYPNHNSFCTMTRCVERAGVWAQEQGKGVSEEVVKKKKSLEEYVNRMAVCRMQGFELLPGVTMMERGAGRLGRQLSME